MVTVLLAVDESLESEHATQIAAELFGSSAHYLAVSVANRGVPWVPVPMVWGGVYPYAPPFPLVQGDVPDRVRDAERAAEAVAADAAEGADIDAEAVGVSGDPVMAILEAADQHGANVIVVGASDKSWWKRLLEGSVSADVAKQSRRPVLLVHPD